MTKKIIKNKASFEAYLNDMFVLAVTAQPTPTKSVGDMLFAKALSYGRTIEDAKADVKRILNVHGAVGLLLSEASETLYDGTVK